MSTRLVERLEREIALAEDPLERECLKAQHAAVIARLGMLDQAKFTLAGLRTQSRRHRNPKLQAWVHYSEGAVQYFSEVNSAQALVHFKAARESAIACADQQLQALTCAWSAAVEIQSRQDIATLASLLEAMSLASQENNSAWARAWLVAADLADAAGWFNESMGGYERARIHAAADGDATMISALMCNRANSLVNHHVRGELFATQTRTEFRRALIEIESTLNLDRGLGNKAFGSSAQFIRAEALVVLGRWSEVIELIDQHMDSHITDSGLQYAARALAGRAWCHANLSHLDKALFDANEAEAHLCHVSDPDDQSVVHKRLAQTFEILGMPARAEHHEVAAAAALDDLAVDQSRLGELLDGFKNQLERIGHPWPLV